MSPKNAGDEPFMMATKLRDIGLGQLVDDFEGYTDDDVAGDADPEDGDEDGEGDE